MSSDTYIPYERETITIRKGNNAWSMNGGFEKFISKKSCPDIVIIQNVDYEDNDVLLPIVAVDDHRVLYGFGKDFGKIYISGIICLSPNTQKGDELVTLLQNEFNSTRATVKEKPITISHTTSGISIKFYAIGIKLHNANPNANYIGFTISGLVTPITNANQQ